jgi:hypothetical protein
MNERWQPEKLPQPGEPQPQPCLSCIMQDVLAQELKQSVPQYSGDKGPTITLESRHGDPFELQCLAHLVTALDLPLRHTIEKLWCDSKSGHITVTTCSSSIFLAKVIARRLDGALLAYNFADGIPSHAGLTLNFGEEYLTCV